MALPVLSLLSLAAREVLVQDLDTRELPSHLQREMERYRRIKGDFSLQSVDLQVERRDKKAVTQEDREYAVQWLFKTDSGDMIKQSGLVMKRTGKDRWTGRQVEGQKRSKFFENLLELLETKLHQAKQIAFKTEGKKRIAYEQGYLENGKLFVTTVENSENRVLGRSHSSFEVNARECLLWVRRIYSSHSGLVLIITTKGTRKTKQNMELLK